MLRRLTYVAIAMLIFEQDYQHIMAMFYLNLAWIIYLGSWQPHQTRIMNKLDLANEFLIVIIFTHLFAFTDMVADVEAQNIMGWSINGFVSLLIAVNLFFILRRAGLQLVLVY